MPRYQRLIVFQQTPPEILVESMRTSTVSNWSINQIQINSPNSFTNLLLSNSKFHSLIIITKNTKMSKYYRAPTAEMASTRSCRAALTDITSPYRAPVADMITQYQAHTANVTSTSSGSYSPRCYKAPEARMN